MKEMQIKGIFSAKVIEQIKKEEPPEPKIKSPKINVSALRPRYLN